MKPAVINGRTILTYEDYAAIPADGRIHQLIQGEVIVTPAPSSRHQLVLMNLIYLLQRYVEEGGLGRLIASPIDVVLTRSDVVQPDVAHRRFSAAVLLWLTATNNLAGFLRRRLYSDAKWPLRPGCYRGETMAEIAGRGALRLGRDDF